MSTTNQTAVASQTEELVIVAPGEAFTYYAKANLQERFPFRAFLRADYLANVVTRIKRPLTLEEIKSFVWEDGKCRSETCVACGKQFTPVAWVDITNRDFLTLLEQGKSLLEALNECFERIHIYGAFYFNPNMDGFYGAFCGSPYFYNRNSLRYDMSYNCLCKAKANHPDNYWGNCRTDLDREIKQFRQAEEERKAAHLAEEIARAKRAKDFFSNKRR